VTGADVNSHLQTVVYGCGPVEVYKASITGGDTGPRAVGNGGSNSTMASCDCEGDCKPTALGIAISSILTLRADSIAGSGICITGFPGCCAGSLQSIDIRYKRNCRACVIADKIIVPSILLGF